MKKINYLFVILLSLLFISCDFDSLFEPDWNAPLKDFFDDYTNTAAIEKHEITSDKYTDLSESTTINSESDCTIYFFMRNPQKYDLDFSTSFPNLASSIDRSSVTIKQTQFDRVKLVLPQSFLIDSDEGKDISCKIRIKEPRSGREFESYSVKLVCNTVPPELYNLTVLNNNEESFTLAFDMPSDSELAIKHKDLSKLTINGVSYDISVDQDGNFTIDDSNFTYTDSSNYIAINGKTFTHTDRSVYFDTKEPFSADDKLYTVILYDKAGFSSKTIASTTITKLETPELFVATGSQILNGTDQTVPLFEDNDFNILTFTPPAKDHLGNDVSGATVVYKIYVGKGSQAKLYASGSASGKKNINLPVGTYNIEAYAIKANYEKSQKVTASVRVADLTLYVRNGANDSEGDGSYSTPYGTIAAAIADIKQRIAESPTAAEQPYTICIEGNLQESVTIDTSTQLQKLTIAGKTGSDADSIPNLTLESQTPVTLSNLKIESADTNAINANLGNLTISNCIVSSNTIALNINNGNVTFTEGTINSNSADTVYITEGTFTATGGNITSNSSPALNIVGSGSVSLTNANLNSKDNDITVLYTAGSLEITGNTKISGYVNISANASGTDLHNTIVTDNTFTGNIVVKPALYTEGIKIVSGKDNSTLTAELLCRFSIPDKDGIGYGLIPDSSGTNALLSKSGTFTGIDFSVSGYTMQIETSQEIDISDVKAGNAQIKWSLKDGATIVSDSETALPSLTNATTELYSNGTKVSSSSSTDGTTPVLTLPQWLPGGTYTIRITGTIGLYTYENEVSLTVKEN